jgi:hypothetical protein
VFSKKKKNYRIFGRIKTFYVIGEKPIFTLGVSSKVNRFFSGNFNFELPVVNFFFQNILRFSLKFCIIFPKDKHGYVNIMVF